MEIVSRGYGIKRFFNKIIKLFIDSPLISSKLRAKLYSVIGVNVVGNCFIGRNVSIDDMYPELVTVGNNTIIANGTKILTHYLDTKKPIHTFYTGEVIIKNDVFIGANVIITKPIIVAEGAVIAAGSVVTKNVEKFTVVAGVPAKIVAKRNSIVRED